MRRTRPEEPFAALELHIERDPRPPAGERPCLRAQDELGPCRRPGCAYPAAACADARTVVVIDLT